MSTSTNATTTREITVPGIGGGRAGHVVPAGTRVIVQRDAGGIYVSGPSVRATVYVDADAVRMDPKVDSYLVQVKDEHGDLSAEEIFPVGQWREIGFWLDNHGFIEAGYVIETRVIEASADAVRMVL